MTYKDHYCRQVLYATFISPVFDLEDMLTFADDNYTIKWNKDIPVMKVQLEASLTIITNWLKQSGLEVNEAKTEI